MNSFKRASPPPLAVPTEEARLVQRAQAGQVEAFAGLVSLHQQFVYNLALRVVRDPLEAEDLAQEAFLRAWRALPQFKGQSSLRTWLYRITLNLCYNRLPHLQSELAALGMETIDELPYERVKLPFDPSPEAALEAKERRAFLQRQVDRLPDSYRVMVTLRFSDGLSYEEIASVMGVPLGTVKTGLFRARNLLRQALRNGEEVWVK